MNPQPAQPAQPAIASEETTTVAGDYIPMLFRLDPDDEDLRDLARFVSDAPGPATMNQRIRRAAGRKP